MATTRRCWRPSACKIIGEALKVATRTDPSHVVETIEIRHAISLRNHIAHDYDGIDDQIIWMPCARTFRN